MKTGISWLDVKLGIRMLAKYPALSLVGGLGIAVAIAIGAGSFAFFYSALYPTIPLDQGGRLVALENWDTRTNNEERHAVHDFATWRAEMKTVQDIGAFRTVRRNLIVPGGPAELVSLAEMSAAGFRAARVPPLVGRHVVPDDEREGAAPVMVIGYEAWRTRFAGDSRIVGRSVRLGNSVHTVVGVMPEGFAFPVSHEFWLPLRAAPSAYARGKGPEIFVFGRLAPGATREQAQAELATLGRRAAAAFPATNATLRPHVVPYTYPILDIQDVAVWEVGMMQLTVSLLLVVVAINVAILVYARTASRQGEIAVRSALGASRRRVVAQLFAEALVLAAVSAVAGLALAQAGLRLANQIMDQETEGSPFWVDYGLSWAAVLYAVGLAVVAAVIVGVLPALQVTGSRLESALRRLGGGTGMRMGKTWTLLVVAQVAIVVAVLPVAVFMGWDQVRHAATRPAFAAGDFYVASLAMDQEPPPGTDPDVYRGERGARLEALRAEFARRLETEPGVSRVTLSSTIPGRERKARIEVPGTPTTADGREVRSGRVDAGFFGAFGAAILAGRGFGPADRDTASTAVVVNRAFVRQLLGGGSAVGRTLRYVVPEEIEPGETPAGDVQAGRRYEIVGVVDDLQENAMDPALVRPAVYHPLALGMGGPATLTIRVQGEAPPSFTRRLREIGTELDPALRLNVVPLAETYRQDEVVVQLTSLVLTLVTASVLLLSAAGIYALMSFAVAQRRREIGIRAALGAHPRQLVRAVFSRAAGQLALGLLAGAGATAALDGISGGDLIGGKGAVILPAVAVVMMVVGLLAAVGPARRGLRIEPTEALRADV